MGTMLYNIQYLKLFNKSKINTILLLMKIYELKETHNIIAYGAIK